MTAPSTFAALITPFLGRAVISVDKLGAESRYTIAKLSDKIGTLKDGSKGEYVVLTKDGETGVVVNLHPNTARKLATKGEGDNFKLVTEAAAAAGVTADEKTAVLDTSGDLSADEQADVKAELAETQAADTTAQPADEAAAPAKATKAPSKKDQTIAIFAAGGVRKDIIAKMKADLGLSDACANTYYQNCKSGAWA